MQKKNLRMIQITDAKVGGFGAESKKIARFLSKLLRQEDEIATNRQRHKGKVSQIS